jgi:predicted secreted protein
MRMAGLAGLAIALLAPSLALAHEDDAQSLRRVSFQVERSREVDNDWLRASVVAQAEDADPAAVADRVNQAMTWALARAKAVPGLKLHTTGYQTWPIQESGRIRRWQASQQLLIEGADASAITKLLGELQNRVQLGSLEFTLSLERRRAVEEELSVEVLKAFRAKAELVADTLGAGSYQIVRVDLGGGGAVVPIHRDMAAASYEMRAKSVAEPSAEGGRSQVSIQASATIELD